MESLDRVAALTARLASAVRLDQIVDIVVEESERLGFGAVWLAVLDDTGKLATLKELFDGVDTTTQLPDRAYNDPRMPIGVSFRERRMVNVTDPDALHVLDGGDESVPPGKLALPRVLHDHVRGHPFVCGPLLGSGGEPVGALGLSSYRGRQPIPDDLFANGPNGPSGPSHVMRVFTDQLGIAIERAVHIARLDDSLRQAREIIAADARTKAVGEIAAAVAHDLNNLLAIAMVGVGVGRRSPADAFNVLPRIERANRAIGDLVARLQRLARPPSGEPDTADVHEIVQDILILTRPLLQERAIDLDIEIAEVPLVRCDAVLVHQVVLNLLVNARDALDSVAADRRRIRLGLRGNGEHVQLTVADSGPGISPAMLGKLFQPFTTTKAGHLGLGLAGAHAQLKQFGGRLAAHNADAGGAVFELTLVAAPPGTPVPAIEPPVRAAESTESPRLSRILAVDDDPDVLFIIRAYLEPLGYQVTTAFSTAQALDAVVGQRFDLVLCDIGLPGQSGLDMPHALKGRGYTGVLVLMTGWDSHKLAGDPRVAESGGLLKKPFTGPELIDAISRAADLAC